MVAVAARAAFQELGAFAIVRMDATFIVTDASTSLRIRFVCTVTRSKT